ncbi:MAG: hypothetical protein PHG20_11380, partial [Geobacteraceae bacterium]|nr:hypothetical protein [Geobacteraceae bacterium]
MENTRISPQNHDQKRRFIVSCHDSALADAPQELYIAEPFVDHLFRTRGLNDKFSDIQVAPFVHKGPDDLYSDNALLWRKYHKYLPLLATGLNRLHGTDLPEDFWRRALSMGLMRHITLVYDHFRICETYFNPRLHSTNSLSPECFHIPLDYNEHRWFLQHSHFGQEQLFSLYLRCFYPEIGNVYKGAYHSPYRISEFSNRVDTDPIVGVMGSLFRQSKLNELALQSNGKINSIGFVRNHTSSLTLKQEERQSLFIKSGDFDRFDHFFFFSLPFLLPREVAEDFPNVMKQLHSQLQKYGRLRYVVSEIFIGESYESIALAILSLRGVRVIYNEHNYSEYPYYSSILDQQTSFADVFAAHGCYSAPVKHMIPSGSLYEFQTDSTPASIREKKNMILYISGIGFAKYSNYSHSFAQTAEHALLYYEFKTAFFKSLQHDILRAILYRPYPRDPNWQLCYDDDALMGTFIELMQRDDYSNSSKERMIQSKLVIIDYIAT